MISSMKSGYFTALSTLPVRWFFTVPSGQVHLQHVALLHLLVDPRALHDGQADVDGVPLEDTREGGRHDGGDARFLDGHRGVLAG